MPGEDGKVCEWSTETWSSINEYSVHGEASAISTAGEGKVWACVAGFFVTEWFSTCRGRGGAFCVPQLRPRGVSRQPGS